MTGRRVLGIGLDPYTINFDTDFFRGKPLNANVIAGGIKADEVRVRAMRHDFEWLLIDARGGRRRRVRLRQRRSHRDHRANQQTHDMLE